VTKLSELVNRVTGPTYAAVLSDLPVRVFSLIFYLFQVIPLPSKFEFEHIKTITN